MPSPSCTIAAERGQVVYTMNIICVAENLAVCTGVMNQAQVVISKAFKNYAIKNYHHPLNRKIVRVLDQK